MFASGAGLEEDDPILTLRQALTKMRAGSGAERTDIVGLVVKAWNAWVADKKLNATQLKLKRTKNDDGAFVTAEFPCLGGIDVEIKPDKKPAKAAKKAETKVTEEKTEDKKDETEEKAE